MRTRGGGPEGVIKSGNFADVINGSSLVRGGRGQDGLGEDGGAGYSGGGGYGYGSGGGGGGSNGAKGEDGADGIGGAGSGLRIDDIPVTNFALSPGEGGVSTITRGAIRSSHEKHHEKCHEKSMILFFSTVSSS